MNLTLDLALVKLADSRTIFHSEADLQFALAWKCKEISPKVGIRLEVPVRTPEHTYNLDLLLLDEGRRIGVELKLLRYPVAVSLAGEDFRLKDAAPDLNRYDFLWDLMRLEKMLAHGLIDEGYALALSNGPTYWQPRTSVKTATHVEFGLEEGRKLTGEMNWAPHTGGTRKGREKPIELHGLYTLHWRNYSEHPGVRFGEFKTLCVQAQTPQEIIIPMEKEIADDEFPELSAIVDEAVVETEAGKTRPWT